MMEDKKQDIARQMREALKAASAHRPPDGEPVAPKRQVEAPAEYDWLPACNAGEFLLPVPYSGRDYICCVREPSWREASRIEMYAFRTHSDGREYFSGEYERRELMRLALLWVADPASREYHVMSLSQMEHGFGEALWPPLSKELFVQFDEAKALSSSARRFFSGEVGGPVHPFILDVDGVTKGMVAFNMSEWSSISMSDFERYQIIWREYYHHIAAPPRPESAQAIPPPPAASRANAQAMSALFGKRSG